MPEETGKISRFVKHLSDDENKLLVKLRQRRAAKNINKEYQEHLSKGDRIADALADTIGSWRFIILQSIILVVWMILNLVAWMHHWDPYPFILLNLTLSFQAAYSAPVIMMSQNRQEKKDRLRSINDYEVNLKVEVEIQKLHEKVDRLLEGMRKVEKA
ncbi:MAG: DUF1003 domain-containing protein [Calditrichaeota bacterium]|nr:DUF1003 domain-containing protein [Calditrichota bacterium]